MSAEVHTLRAAALALMAACISVSLVVLLEAGWSSWHGSYLVILCALAAGEGYVGYVLRKSEAAADARVPLWWFEVAFWLAAVQLAADAAEGLAPFSAGLPVIHSAGLAQAVPALVCWLSAAATAADLRKIERSETRGLRRFPSQQAIAFRLLAGGVMLFLIAGLTQPSVQTTLHLPVAAHGGPTLNVLAYFLLTIAVLVHVSYETRRQSWQEREMSAASGIGGSWARYAAAFLALAMAAALLIQLSHPFGLVAATRGVWSAMLAWLAQLLEHFKGGTLPRQRTLPTLPPITPPPGTTKQPPHTHSGSSTGTGWFDVTRVLIFWALIAAAAAYLVRTYLRRRTGRARLLGRSIPILGALLRLWDAVRRVFGRYISIRPHLPEDTRLGALVPSFLRGRRVSADARFSGSRGRVIAYYLSATRTLDRRGFKRPRGQTPLEYSASVGPLLAESEQDMHRLTDAFLEARYSKHPVDASRVSMAREAWRRLREAIRSVRSR